MAAVMQWRRLSLVGSHPRVGSSSQGKRVTASGDRALLKDVSFRDVPLDILQGTGTSGGWTWAPAPGGAWPPAAAQQHALPSPGQVRSLVPQRLTVRTSFQVIWFSAVDKMKQLKQAGWPAEPIKAKSKLTCQRMSRCLARARMLFWLWHFM